MTEVAAGELHYDESPVLGAGLDQFSLPAFSAYHQVQFGTTLETQLAQSGLDLSQLLRNLRLLHEVVASWSRSVSPSPRPIPGKPGTWISGVTCKSW